MTSGPALDARVVGCSEEQQLLLDRFLDRDRLPSSAGLDPVDWRRLSPPLRYYAVL